MIFLFKTWKCVWKKKKLKKPNLFIYFSLTQLNILMKSILFNKINNIQIILIYIL